MPKRKKDAPDQALSLLISESNGHRLEFDEKSHRYHLDGLSIPGVTGILKGGYPTSEGLIIWRIKQGIEEHLSGEKLKKAANIGTIVHDIIEKAEAGKPYEIPDIEEVRNCFGAYEDFKELRHPYEKVISAEEIIASPTYGYAGKYDVLLDLEGKTVIRDYKTAGSVYKSAFLQCALYAIGLKEWKNITVDYWQVVRFPKEGKFNLERDMVTMSDAKAMEEFTSQAIRCVQTYFFILKYDSNKGK